MKRNILVFFLIISICTWMTSCDEDDRYLPGKEVVKAFNNKYPDAKRIEWEKEGNVEKVDFRWDAREHTAYFENSGRWLVTKTDYRYKDLPDAVKRSFEASQYADWRIDETDRIEQDAAATIYKIEVEKSGREDVIFYLENGEVTDAPVRIMY